MAKQSTVLERKLKEARKELEELTSDLPTLEAMLAEREAELAEAKRGNKDFNAVMDVQVRYDAVKNMLERQRADVVEVTETVNGLEGQLETLGQQERLAAIQEEHAALRTKYPEVVRAAFERIVEELRTVNDLEQQINATHFQNASLARRFGVPAQNTKDLSGRTFGGTIAGFGLAQVYELDSIETLKRSRRCQPDFEPPTPEALAEMQRQQEEKRHASMIEGRKSIVTRAVRQGTKNSGRAQFDALVESLEGAGWTYGVHYGENGPEVVWTQEAQEVPA